MYLNLCHVTQTWNASRAEKKAFPLADCIWPLKLWRLRASRCYTCCTLNLKWIALLPKTKICRATIDRVALLESPLLQRIIIIKNFRNMVTPNPLPVIREGIGAEKNISFIGITINLLSIFFAPIQRASSWFLVMALWITEKSCLVGNVARLPSSDWQSHWDIKTKTKHYFSNLCIMPSRAGVCHTGVPY